MSKVKIDANIEASTAENIRLLAKHKFRSDRAFSAYVNIVLGDHCDANKDLITRLKANPANLSKPGKK